MTDLDVSFREIAKYHKVWQQPAYRRVCHGLTLWTTCRSLFPLRPQTAIDIGCGLGLLIPRWADEGIEGYGVDLVPHDSLDPAVLRDWYHRVEMASLWDYTPDRVFDMGVCADVMEHIPVEFVERSLMRIAQYTRMCVFKIAWFPSVFLGHTLHVTRKPAWWWLSVMRATMPGRVDVVPYPTIKDEAVFVWHGLTS